MILHDLIAICCDLVGLFMMVGVLLTDETEDGSMHYFYCFLVMVCLLAAELAVMR